MAAFVGAGALFIAGCGGNDGDGESSRQQTPVEAANSTETSIENLEAVQERLEAGGYETVPLVKRIDLVNYNYGPGGNGEPILASEGLAINGKGLQEAAVYFFEDRTDADTLSDSLAGLAHVVRGNIVFFDGSAAKDSSKLDEMVSEAQGDDEGSSELDLARTDLEMLISRDLPSEMLRLTGSRAKVLGVTCVNQKDLNFRCLATTAGATSGRQQLIIRGSCDDTRCVWNTVRW